MKDAILAFLDIFKTMTESLREMYFKLQSKICKQTRNPKMQYH